MKIIRLIFPAILALTACQQPAINVPTDSENSINLNSLLTLQKGENTVYTQDYVLKPEQLDSVTASTKALSIKLSPDKKIIALTPADSMPHFVDLKLWVKGVAYSIPCRKTDKISYTFTFNPKGKSYKQVQIAGQMNDWTPAKTPDLKLNAKGLYEVPLYLSPGSYLYQMKIDGDQNHDPNNPDKVDNGYGKFNSILQVKGNADKYPRLITNKFNINTITLNLQNEAKKVYVYWQNYLLPDQLVMVQPKNVLITIPAEANSVERSYIRVWACNDYGVSNDILVPLEKGKVVADAAQITRTDKHAQIMYFMLVDRFMNGDTTNDHPMNRPDVNHKVDYWGGDLAGIQQKIDEGYFEKLGVNTLWVSPVNQNPTEPYGF